MNTALVWLQLATALTTQAASTRPAAGDWKLLTDPSRIEFALSPLPDEGQAYALLTVTYFANDGQIVGAFQRFEEGMKGGLSTFRLPTPPTRARFVRAGLQRLRVPEEFEKAEWKSQWYSHTWSHFTTATYTRGCFSFVVVSGPVDTDLKGWFGKCEVPFDSAESVTSERLDLP